MDALYLVIGLGNKNLKNLSVFEVEFVAALLVYLRQARQ